ncbi:MAG TPA: glycosyltransferase family 2 protein [Rudaea sp.]|nr:glycosyltransferase family 2 protein [Rudaea sp.]
MALPISIFIIAFNEAARIGATLSSVRELSDDVIVVDSGSTDGTQDIAASFGARVVHNPWPGYGAQKRFGEDQCRHPWRLNLDADEVASLDLIAEIHSLFAHSEPAAGAYSVRIVDVIPGDSKPRAFAYAHKKVRLNHKNAGRFSPSPVHDAVALHPAVKVMRLRGAVHHFSMRTLGEQLHKFNAYTDALVLDLRRRNKSIPTWRVFVEFPMAFCKAYFMRRHCLRGTYGFLTAMNYAYFRHLRVAKFHEARRNTHE